MQIGIISQSISKQDIMLFKKSAAARGINLQIIEKSSLVVAINNNKLLLLDGYLKPIKLQGIINWEPYPVFEEIENTCKSLGIPFINSIEAVRTARNKVLTNIVLSRSGLPQPNMVYYNNSISDNNFFEQLEFPLVCKPKSGTQGRGAFLFNSLAEFRSFAGAKIYKDGFYLQSYIANDGWDIRVVVARNQVLGAIKRIAAQGEWRTHALHGGTARPFIVDKELEQLSLSSIKALGLSFAGVDVIVDSREGKYKILEVNSVPRLKTFKETMGFCITDSLLDLISSLVRIKKRDNFAS